MIAKIDWPTPMPPNYFALFLLVCVPLAAYLIFCLFRLEQRLGRARPRSGLLFFPLLLGVLYLFYLDGAMESDRGHAFMREQLNIPDEVSIKTHNGAMKQPNCYSSAGLYYANAQFPPGQFSRYLAATSTKELWRPMIPPTSTINQAVSVSPRMPCSGANCLPRPTMVASKWCTRSPAKMFEGGGRFATISPQRQTCRRLLPEMESRCIW